MALHRAVSAGRGTGEGEAMSDADLSREEFVQERLAIMAADGLKFDERQARAEAILAWERLCADMRREEYRVIVCGGRDYVDRECLRRVLGELPRRPTLIVEGGAEGADLMARRWAEAQGIKRVTVEADWRRYGKAAGPIRNREMLRKHRPHLVVAFPGGRGTADMMQAARDAGVSVLDVRRQLDGDGVGARGDENTSGTQGSVSAAPSNA